MKVKGDIVVQNNGIFNRRADQGLKYDSTISGTVVLERNCARWQDLGSASSNEDVVLPDATLLPIGWEVVINNNGSFNLDVYDGDPTAPTLLRTILPTANCGTTPTALVFTLRTGGTSAGEWYVSSLNDRNFYYQNTCPTGSITQGSMWYDSETGKLSVYFYDPISDSCVWATPSVDCCPPPNLDVTIEQTNITPPSGGPPDSWSITLSAFVSGGTAPYTYSWSRASTLFNDGYPLLIPNGSTTSQTIQLDHANTTPPVTGSFIAPASELWKVKVTDYDGNSVKDYIQVQTLNV